MHRTILRLSILAGALAPLSLAAQGPGSREPTDAAAAVPASAYRSAFDGYLKFREPALADWRAANDEVARIGGHIGIFRAGGFDGGDPAPASPPSAPVHRH